MRRHHWIVRVTHWCAFILLFGMIASGLQIYRAYPRFGERGGPYYPQPFQDVVFPEWARLGGWLAGGINWHLFLMWPLMLVGLVYIGYLIVSGEWRKLLFRPRDAKPALEMHKQVLPPPPEGPSSTRQAQRAPEARVHPHCWSGSALRADRMGDLQAGAVMVAHCYVRGFPGSTVLALLGSLAVRGLQRDPYGSRLRGRSGIPPRHGHWQVRREVHE